jgi:ATP-dependent DNA ligase
VSSTSKGVVAKRVDEPYRSGKRGWLKVKHWDTLDLVVGGYAGTAERMSLLLGAYDGDSLTYVGQTVAIPRKEAAELMRSLQSLSCEESFHHGPTPAYSRCDSHRFDEWFPFGRGLSVRSPSPGWTGTLSVTRRVSYDGGLTRVQRNAP